MPGLGVADMLQESYEQAIAGNPDEAMERFEKVLPYLVFSLQNMELLVQMEKSLLVRRSLIAHDTVRSTTLTPDAHTVAHVQYLVDRVMGVLEPSPS